jgi:hypothetical protein
MAIWRVDHKAFRTRKTVLENPFVVTVARGVAFCMYVNITSDVQYRRHVKSRDLAIGELQVGAYGSVART